jgi:hypothetical protein
LSECQAVFQEVDSGFSVERVPHRLKSPERRPDFLEDRSPCAATLPPLEWQRMEDHRADYDAREAEAEIALAELPDASPYGRVQMDDIIARPHVQRLNFLSQSAQHPFEYFLDARLGGELAQRRLIGNLAQAERLAQHFASPVGLAKCCT